MPALLILSKLIGILAILAGCGFLSAKLFERLARLELSGLGWFELAVLGTVAAYTYAAVLALLFPLGGPADLLFTVIGAIGFITAAWGRRQFSHPWALGCGLALSILVAAGTVHTPVNYDAGLYYLQNAKILESDGVALGLANVHFRFGFNSAIVPLSVLFHGSVFGRDGLFLLGPALFLAFAGALLEQITFGLISRTPDAGSVFSFFGVASWLVPFHQTVLSWFSLSPSGDLAAAAATLYCPVAMLGLCRAAGDRDHAAFRRFAVLLPVAAAFAITAKLATAPIALLVALPWILLRPHTTEKVDMRAAWAGLGCAAVVLFLWVLHDFLLTGCLIYPVPGTCFAGVPWTPHLASVNAARDVIRAWARAPGDPIESSLRGWTWPASWQTKMLPERPFIFTLLKAFPVFLAVALALRIAFRTGSGDERAKLAARALAGVWIVNLIGLAFWFLSAPDPRFGLGFMLGILASSAALIVVPAASYTLDRNHARTLVVVVSGTLLAMLLYHGVFAAKLTENLQAMPWRTMRFPNTRYMENDQKLTLAVPLSGDQCWDVVLLCSPEAFPNLNRTQVLGRTVYTVHGTSVLRPVSAPEIVAPGLIPREPEQR